MCWYMSIITIASFTCIKTLFCSWCFSDEAGCFASPRNSMRRPNPSKAQNNFPRPTSSCGYDRPQFLMTFQATSPDPTSEEGMSFKFSPRAECSPHNFPSPSSSPRHFGGFGKDFAMVCSTERLPTGDMTDDPKHTTMKKVFSSPNTGGTKKETQKGNAEGNERVLHPDKIRMCSEPPTVVMADTLMSAYSTHAIQETGRATPPGHLSPFAVKISGGNQMYGDMYLVRSPGSRQRFIVPQPSQYLQTCANPNAYKQASCPQLFEEVTLMDLQPENFMTMSRSFFNNNRGGLTKSPSRSVQNIHDPRETQDDFHTNMTSGSYLINPDDLPQSDAFVWVPLCVYHSLICYRSTAFVSDNNNRPHEQHYIDRPNFAFHKDISVLYNDTMTFSHVRN